VARCNCKARFVDRRENPEPRHAKDCPARVSARKALKAAQAKPGPKLPKPPAQKWDPLFSAEVEHQDGGTTQAFVTIGRSEHRARLIVDLNDGRMATVYLDRHQLHNLGMASVNGAFYMAPPAHGKKRRG
jgi:hypothetical protein